VNYRADIDGLRALAVVPVVLFHAHFASFSGGYVGVDIFFVISGFLITRILHRELDADRYSIWRFYERRIRRIFPALFVVLASVAAVSAIIMMPDDLRELGKYLVATTMFAANILFWLETDYFGAPAELNPLLHTWSLAVEEQYYIIFPLLLALAFRVARNWVVSLLVGCFIISFAVSIWSVYSEPTGAFYLLQSRAWELLCGSLLALGVMPTIRSRMGNEFLAWAGLGAILTSVFAYTSDTRFPGLAAVLPCFGTCALIHAGQAGTLPTRLLSLRPVAGVGLVSYSLYLWHWPLIVLSEYQLMRKLESMERLEVAAASIVLAFLSWRFVERPFRRPDGVIRPRQLFPVAALTMVAVLSGGGGLYLLDGLPQRIQELANLKKIPAATDGTVRSDRCFLETEMTYQEWTADNCMLVANGPHRALLWGDSHAHQYASAIKAASHDIPIGVVQYSAAGCAPVFGGDFSARPNCRSFNDNVLEVIKAQRIDTIILVAYWERHLKQSNFNVAELMDTIRTLNKLGLKVVVIGQLPIQSYRNPIQVALRRNQANDHAPIYYAAPVGNPRFNKVFAAELKEVVFVDPTLSLCRGEVCLYMLNEALLYRDDNHLSYLGSSYVLDHAIIPQLRALYQPDS
jgi:peptidoglycan/LPS O-acetylase OafA/YrhL